ncbi:ATP-binding protein [Polynucleobacter sp. UK-Gri1-W3]|uniref:ATP-binding protein n=1 Tax=Polynucleobacter sp. UK-Gri1-W3 TaxID=1819737 RepID=UPI001C0DA068|nr:ATP-binding protein [Polynucleobacter sp. UK-Gri1-W3]MBU3538202.1 ATP-binding protein [Polynucleobacter sp. UK-Gri1-W3]
MDPRRNPFSPGAGSAPPELSGRDKVIEDVSIALHRIRNGLSAKSILIVGLRGVGKTVLLNRLKNDAESEGLVCVQFESPENRNLPAMIVPSLRAALFKLNRLSGLSDKVAKAARILGSFISSAKVKYEGMEFGFDLGTEPGVSDTGDLDYDLSELLQAIGEAAKEKKTAVVLFIDELQYVPELELAALISALHGCAQKGLPVALVGAGLPQLVGNVGKAKSYAERLFDFPEIGPLLPDAATKALQLPVSQHQVSFETQAIEQILRQTKGYPYFLQEWGSMCWEVANSKVITEDDALAATELAILQLDSSFFRVRFDRCTPMEKNYLRAMAGINSPAPRSGDIASAMNKEVHQIAPLRQSLISKGMIYSPAHGDTAFTVPLFADYMKRMLP